MEECNRPIPVLQLYVQGYIDCIKNMKARLDKLNKKWGLRIN